MSIKVLITLSLQNTDPNAPFGYEDLDKAFVKLAAAVPGNGGSITDLLGQDIFTPSGDILIRVEDCTAVFIDG
jgi:hypothetical protein